MTTAPDRIHFDWAGATPVERDAWIAANVMGEPKPDYPDPEPIHSSRVGRSACGWWHHSRDGRGWLPRPFSTDVAADYRVLARLREVIGRCAWDDYCDALEKVWYDRQQRSYFDRFSAFIGVPVGLYEPGDYSAAAWAIRLDLDQLDGEPAAIARRRTA
jgi:hypothetical protein